MTKRPHIPERVKIDVAIHQAFGSTIICPLCKGKIDRFCQRTLEHMVPHELGGSSEFENLAFVHTECAEKKREALATSTA